MAIDMDDFETVAAIQEFQGKVNDLALAVFKKLELPISEYEEFMDGFRSDFANVLTNNLD